MPTGDPEEVTVLLEAIARGDRSAWSRLAPLVHREVRDIARARLAGLPSGQSLRATELVNETFVRLLPGEGSRLRTAKAQKEGVRLPASVWEETRKIGRELGVSLDDLS